MFPAGCLSRVLGAGGRGSHPWDTQGILDAPGMRGYRTPQPVLSPRNAQSQPLRLHPLSDHCSTHWDLGFPALQLCSPAPTLHPGATTGLGTLGRAPDVTTDGDTPNTARFSHPGEPVLPTPHPGTDVPRSRNYPGLAKGLRFSSSCAQEPLSLPFPPLPVWGSWHSGITAPLGRCQAGRATAGNIPEASPRKGPGLAAFGLDPGAVRR